MKNLFSKAMALTLAVLMVVSQMVFASVAVDTEIPDCLCEAALRGDNDEIIGHVDATCGEYGYDVKLCAECGGKYTVNTELPTGKHELNIPEATCDEDSYCVNCDYVNEEAIGHDYKPVSVDPDCENDGYTMEVCDNCGDEINVVVIPATGHDWKLVEGEGQAPTCTQQGFVSGYEVYECQNANCPVGRKIEELPAPTEHLHYEWVFHDRTCTEGAYIHHSCNVCGYELIEYLKGEEYEAPGHDWKEFPGKEATCTATGYTAWRQCNVCKLREGFEVIPMINHVNGDPVEENLVPATCVDDGSKDVVVYCAYGCGTELSRTPEVIPAEPGYHDYGEPVVVAPTCIEGGYTYELCVKCNDENRYDEVGPDLLNGHKNKLVGRVEATCTAEGWTGDLTCELCGDILNKGKVIPMKDHEIVVHDAKDPTCTEIGWYEYETCNNCDYSTYVEIPALGHTKSDISVGVVAPTCDEDGYTIWKCACCPETFRADFVDKLNHFDPITGESALVEYEAKAPTCDEPGWNAYEECTICDYTTYVEIPALDHEDTIVIDPAVEPDCDNVGYTEGSHCEACGAVIIPQDEIPALGHLYDGEWVIEDHLDPTCTEDGYDYYVLRCTREGCGDVLDEDTVVLQTPGHDIVDTVVPATPESIGYINSACTVCDFVENTPINEEIHFFYNISGINGANVAVNSGYVTVEIYADVLTDYARIHGIDFAFDYDSALEFVGADSEFLDDFMCATNGNTIKFTANVNSDVDVVFEKGEHLVATLTFVVADNFYNDNVVLNVNLDECFISYADYDDEFDGEFAVVATYDESASIFVAMLGDSDEDGKITTKDDQAFYNWFFNNDEYKAVLDMNKDGVISEADNWLLRAEILNIGA